ncbi:MAG TPA: ribonuclease H-like domain-containing protein [Abditibacteriaceae bacterium]|nr:ribonuclease H-like domain-containing protein [Abditibacteriaceae bacterium]
MAGSWEDIANEVAPLGARPGGLATGASRGKKLAAARVVACPPCAKGASLDEALGGVERDVAGCGLYYHIQRPASTFDAAFANLSARLPGALPKSQILRGARLDDLLFVDIETTGLSSSTPLFLIGTLGVGADEPQLELFLARGFAEERAVLAAFHHAARGKSLVTFNGKAFDWPYIEGRSRRHRLGFEPPTAHFDLLHHARRAWKPGLPNCRLQTLESHLCRRSREGDVASSRIPDQYHEFVEMYDFSQRGAHLLAPIVYHNALDILTMAELVCLAGESNP